MEIEFYKKKTGNAVDANDYFVLDGSEVWADNYKVMESQSAAVTFDDFIIRCEDIGWRVINEE